MSRLNVKDEVIKLIKRFNTNDPFIIAKNLNVIIRLVPIGNIFGYHISDSRFDVIHINAKLDDEMKIFVCAHELGHAVLHKGVSTNFLRYHSFFTMGKLERQAHTFAVELILPDYYLQEHPEFGLYQLADLHGIPRNLVKLKAH